MEVYEGDPFEASCCGPVRMSEESVEKLRRMLIERNETLRKLREKFSGALDIERDIVSSRRGLMKYPEHVRNVLSERGWNSLPYVFVEGRLVSAGKFPSYEEFLVLLKPYLQNAATWKVALNHPDRGLAG